MVPLRMTSSWIRVLFWLYLLVLVWADGTTFNRTDPDLWHRLALGEYLDQHGHFPTGDTFSYLADYQNTADHEWGSAVLFYAIYAATGGGALFGSAMVGLKLITLALTLALVVWAGLRQRRPSVLAAAFYAIVLLALLPSFLSTLRCVVFTHLFLALWLYWFQCERHGTRIPTWAYPLTMLPWANLHGGFTIGLFWLGLVAVLEWSRGAVWQKWVHRLSLCFLVTFINPFGWHLWTATLRALASPRQGFAEWAPVHWFASDYPGYKLLLLATAIALAYLLRTRNRHPIDRTKLLLIAAFLLLSLTSARQTSLYALVLGALLPGLLPPAPHASAIRIPLRRIGYIAISCLLLLVPFYAALIVFPGEALQLTYDPVSCPVGAVGFLEQNGVRGDLLTPFNYGSYAMWKLRGKMRVSMDGRYDLVYKPATYLRVTDFYLGKSDGQTLLTTPKPSAILVPVDDKVYPQLAANSAWALSYRNSTDAVFLPR
jgi:hypothetical protein